MTAALTERAHEPDTPFMMRKSTITGLWVSQSQSGQLRASFKTADEALLDMKRLNAAWRMGYEAAKSSNEPCS